MLLTNFKIFYSNLLKHKLFTLVNVFGLSIGFASCLLISLYVVDEFSYDRQHPGADRIHRVSSILTGLGPGGRTPIPSMSPQAGPLLQRNFPEVEAFTRESSEPVYLSLDDLGHHEDRISFADPNFFDFFLFTWLQGEPSAALSEPDSIVLTESLAFKYFGTTDVLGKTLQLQRQRPLKVTGVIRDLQRTHIDAVAFVTLSTLEWLQEPQAMEDWFNNRFQTYVRLREHASFTRLQPLFHQFLEDQMPPAAKSIYGPDSMAVRDIHLFSSQSTGVSRESRTQGIIALMMVCAALLAIACINFINLATARSSDRSKEIAMRKVLGARRGQIFRQHLGESGLLVLLSLLLGLGITELSLPVLNGFTGKAIGLTGTPFLLSAISGLGLIVALLAGGYPSLYLSAFMPAKVFKSAGGAGKGGFVFRNVLVVVQFAIAIVLIVATAVIHQQVQYGKRIELGFDKDQVLVIENEAGSDWALFKERVSATVGVSEVSAAMTRPFRPRATSVIARHEGGSPDGESRAFFAVDFDYFELFDVEFIAGRSFAEHLGGDSIVQPTAENPRGRAVFVLNRAMVDSLGWTPDEATGKWIELNWSENYAQSVRGEVIGVTENMRADSLRREVTPLLYWVPTNVSGLSHGLIKVSTTDVAQTLQRIDAVWREVYPDRPIDRYFLDDEFRVLYEAEERQAALLGVFALLAIVISCLGLFGLAAFTAERRRKEVGIRKVLGGGVWRTVLLLTNDFSKLVLLANVIAWPVAWFAMDRWLSNFAYRIDLTPLIFIGSGLIALCIAWVTVGGTALRSASARPVLALRYE